MRTGAWVLAAVVAAAVGFALWTGSSVPDPVGRGAIAPAFALRELPGPGELSLASLRGQVVLLNFWATWCEPCEREMPAMQRLHQKLGPDGLHLVAVSVDDSTEPVEQFRARFALTFRIVWDPDKRVSDAYQAYRYPETLLIDRDGVVVERYIGPRDWDSPLYEARIRRLLEGEIVRWIQALRQKLAGLLDAIDYLVYGLLFLLGFGGLAYMAYVSIVG